MKKAPSNTESFVITMVKFYWQVQNCNGWRDKRYSCHPELIQGPIPIPELIFVDMLQKSTFDDFHLHHLKQSCTSSKDSITCKVLTNVQPRKRHYTSCIHVGHQDNQKQLHCEPMDIISFKSSLTTLFSKPVINYRVHNNHHSSAEAKTHKTTIILPLGTAL